MATTEERLHDVEVIVDALAQLEGRSLEQAELHVKDCVRVLHRWLFGKTVVPTVRDRNGTEIKVGDVLLKVILEVEIRTVYYRVLQVNENGTIDLAQTAAFCVTIGDDPSHYILFERAGETLCHQRWQTPR